MGQACAGYHNAVEAFVEKAMMAASLKQITGDIS
jgi:hypothetical protein